MKFLLILFICAVSLSAQEFSKLKIEKGSEQGVYDVFKKDVWTISSILEIHSNSILVGKRLELKPGARIQTYGHHLRILISEEIRCPEKDNYGVICTTYQGKDGVPDKNGEPGKAGNVFLVCPVISGYLCIDTQGGNGGNGGRGCSGKDGKDGIPGEDGEDAQYQILRTGQSKGRVYFTRLPAPGRPGSEGENGQDGQNGRNGGDGGDGGWINIITSQSGGGLKVITTGGQGGIGGEGGIAGQGGRPGKHGKNGEIIDLKKLPPLEWSYYQAPSDLRLPGPKEIYSLVAKQLQGQKDYNVPFSLLNYWEELVKARLMFRPLPEFQGEIPHTKIIPYLSTLQPTPAPPKSPGGRGNNGKPGSSGETGKSGQIAIPDGMKKQWVVKLLDIETQFVLGKITEQEWRGLRKKFKE